MYTRRGLRDKFENVETCLFLYKKSNWYLKAFEPIYVSISYWSLKTHYVYGSRTEKSKLFVKTKDKFLSLKKYKK